MDFYLAKELGMKEAIIAHEADFEDMLKMDFHGVIPEAVIKGRIPAMVSEHCMVGDLKLCPCNKEEERFYLKDRKGQLYPVLINSNGCSSMILSQKETNLTMRKTELKKAGIKRFRIYVG